MAKTAVADHLTEDPKPAPRSRTSAPKKTAHRHAKVAPQSALKVIAPGHHEIAMLAYRYWEERHYQHGFAEEDWARAVEELSQK